MKRQLRKHLSLIILAVYLLSSITSEGTVYMEQTPGVPRLWLLEIIQIKSQSPVERKTGLACRGIEETTMTQGSCNAEPGGTEFSWDIQNTEGLRNTVARSGKVRLEVIFGANPRARSFSEHHCQMWGAGGISLLWEPNTKSKSKYLMLKSS